MKSKFGACLIFLVGLLAVSVPAFAHHGSSISYDLKKTVTLKGTVSEFVWSNPHCQIYFDVKDDHGNVVRWGAETNGPGALAKEGWTKTTLKPGDEATIVVFPAKIGRPYGLLSKVVFAGGKELVTVSTETAAGRKDGQPDY
jgi:uncharacterized protein DUF6152